MALLATFMLFASVGAFASSSNQSKSELNKLKMLPMYVTFNVTTSCGGQHSHSFYCLGVCTTVQLNIELERYRQQQELLCVPLSHYC